MSYTFYCRVNAEAGNSGSSNTDAAKWSGTVTRSAANHVTTSTTPTGVVVGDFIRILYGTSDINVRITGVDGTDLTLAEDVSADVSTGTAKIGGAITFMEVTGWSDGADYYPSAIPYGEPNKSVDADVDIYLETGTYAFADDYSDYYPCIKSDTQNTNKYSRRIIGGGLVNGVFIGPTFNAASCADGLYLLANNVTIHGLKIVNARYFCFSVGTGTDIATNVLLSQCFAGSMEFNAVGYGFCIQNNNVASVQECIAENLQHGIYASDTTVSRCRCESCAHPFRGRRSVWIDCVESNSKISIVNVNAVPGGMDFINCTFNSARPPSQTYGHYWMSFTNCSFKHTFSLDAKGLLFQNCASSGVITAATNKTYHPLPQKEWWFDNSGYDTHTELWREGINRKLPFPDPVLDRINFEVIGCHGLRVPVEAAKGTKRGRFTVFRNGIKRRLFGLRG